MHAHETMHTIDLPALKQSAIVQLGGKGFGDALTFDNAYYKSLLTKPWESKDAMAQMIGLPSDHVLPDDSVCRPDIERFAADQPLFFREFESALVKMTSSGAPWTAAATL